MITTKNFIFFALTACLVFVFACKKEKNPKITVPELSTTAITNIVGNSATGGGNISSNGGETISASGLCWSTINQIPTISDDTTRVNATSGLFTSSLTELSPSSTYYVRAYAINSAGVGYGSVVTFNTGNGSPTATSLVITGDAIVGAELTATYNYNDPELDPESGTVFKWYVADNASGADETEIVGATESTYIINDEQEGKYIRFGVIPKSSAGNLIGTEVKSNFIGAIGEETIVTFSYNGAEVTYGIITSTVTGKKFLDRNLGAKHVAQNINDYEAYGDLFQWGRLADGHQLVIRTGPNDEDVTGVNGITSTTAPYQTSDVDVPATNKFIIGGGLSSPGDWRNPQNSNLWQGVDGINNPCPDGWRIPTTDEWAAENFSDGPDAFDKLKLTYSGQRNRRTGVVSISTYGVYWTSTSVELSNPGQFGSGNITFDATTFSTGYTNRAMGQPCRCIKD